MNDFLKNLISRLSDAPKWVKIVVSVLLSLLCAVSIFLSLTSCGAVTRATVRNGADGTSTSVTITTNNPTNWTVTPDVEINPK